MPDLQHLLDQIDRLDQDATKGPWIIDDSCVYGPPYGEGGYRKYPELAYITRSDHDAEFIALARTVLPQLAKALRAVIELHQPYQYNGLGDGFCEGCSDIDWEISYPCPTVQAITDAMEGDND